MKRWIGALLCSIALLTASAGANDDLPLPTRDGEEPGEIEPPLLIQSRGRDGSIADLPGTPTEPASADVAKLETDLLRAQKRAAGADRLYRAGIIAKVDAEQRALKVVQLEAAIAQARLGAAKAKAESTGDAATEASVANAEASAKRALEERQRAELEAAFRNLQRQQKLLALGSGRKADVTRAEARLAELQQAELVELQPSGQPQQVKQ
ncbi:MAG: hypothetical protein AVDCRST_MAG42-3102 [uncultured Chthoniobacterales bacterium]|uniref:Uncharacterized protein n=1 Tax=uncultured Chthoniobacterales bacterium TaxID=1836801 RepID=A0A6J4J4M7_9BACT|nr:MAG: hypothetical protein AVDCRST_MAG42-3102 [uncultured Chthoniobacterales bacterium]